MKNVKFITKESSLLVFLFLFIGVLTMVAPLLAREDDTAVAQDPNFTNIDDPLNGNFELYTVDDLVLSQVGFQGNTGLKNEIFLMPTESETVTGQSVVSLADPPCIVDIATDDNPYYYTQQPQFTRAGHFFVLPYDVVVTLAPTATNAFDNCDSGGANNMALYVNDDVSGLPTAVYPFYLPPYYTAVAKADFNLDGFSDLFMMGQNYESDKSIEALVASATDINDRSQGFSFGPRTTSSEIQAAWNDPVTGDFNDDGLVDVAWVAGNIEDTNLAVRFATVCPGAVAGTICADKDEFEIIFNPLQSQATQIQTQCVPAGALAAGRFVNEPGDGLLVLDCKAFNGITSQFDWYEFNGDFSIEGGEPRDTLSGAVTSPYYLSSQGEAAPLTWLDDLEQVVYAYGGSYNCSEVPLGGFNQATLGVITFTSDKMSEKHVLAAKNDCTFAGYLNYTWLNGLAVGRFADVTDNPSNDSAFNLQIATYTNEGDVRIFTVNPPTDYTPELASTFKTTGVPGKGILGGPNTLVAADLQGRSAHLGPPSVMRISSHSQPSVILGAPPMHIDYVLPDGTTASAADIVNFSAVPSSFQSQYTMSETGSNQSSDTNTTSYSYTTTEEGMVGFNLKPPYLPSVKGSIKTTTSDKDETVSSDYAFEKNEFEYDASTTTGFSDEIWYSENSFNLYIYRVLGETACPADNPTCTPEEEQPLYVMFSGPNSSGTGPASGATTEWYQPVHEPGNIFSYPWDQTQLQYQFDQVHLLSGPQHFFTDGSTQTQHLSWAQGQGSNVTAGSSNNHSYEKGYSLTAGKTIGKILDINIEGDIDYNESTSLETLNQSTSSMGASQGIAISKPGDFLNYPLYQYRVEPYIFGRPPDPQAVDNPDVPEQVKAFGPLQAAFAANPLASGSGSWWTSSQNPYKQSFDVALNHPVRWTVDVVSKGSGLNCLGSAVDCLTFNAPDPDNLWNSEFYWMRGLFVTLNGGSGPQRNQATAGDNVFLTTRVYNYSFMDMPVDSTIKVRFYRQELNGTVPSGNSVLIDEVDIDPLVGFNSDSAPDTPNWATAGTSFDTTGLDNTTHIFWVLVWAEDSGGNMLSELAGHGLSTKPGSLNSIGDVLLEEVTLDGAQQTFSNNVGYLHSKFYIASTGVEAPPPAGAPFLSIENAEVTPNEAAPGDKVIISADVLSTGAAADAVSVQFFPDAGAWQAYQDDPSLEAPRAFDIEMLPHINAGETDHLEVPFRTNACGMQHILIVAQSGPQAEPVTATALFSTGDCLTYLPFLSK